MWCASLRERRMPKASNKAPTCCEASYSSYLEVLITLFFDKKVGPHQFPIREFDPGSERTLAARLTHASRAGLYPEVGFG